MDFHLSSLAITRRPPPLVLAMTLAGGLLFGSFANAQTPLYTLTSQSGGTGFPTVAFSSTAADSVAVGDQVSVQLADGTISNGNVASEHSANPLNADTMLQTTSTKVIAIDGGGSVELHIYNSSIVGMTIFDASNGTFHRSILTSEGSGVLMNEDPNAYFCADMPIADFSNQAPLSIDPAQVPTLFEIQNLESKPGATKIIYIEPWGGTLTGSAWNTATGFPIINYDPYDKDGNTATFSDTERYEIYHSWLEAAEDYAPFDVNVTTRASVWTATSDVNKSRIAMTTFASAATYNLCLGGSCGGIAYVGQYGGNVLYQTGWTFNNAIGASGMTHSHEAGHQMGLSHDGGAANPNYYSGHGVWGPVMGAPFGQPYVQWSKGDYPGATNQEDDFAIIDGKLGTLADQEGDSPANGLNLGTVISHSEIYKAMPEGAVGTQIGGAAGGDSDVFNFTVPASGGDVSLVIAPVAGVDTTQNAAGEDRGSNISLKARLRAAGSTTNIAAHLPPIPLALNANKLEYTGTLPGGDYNILVDQVIYGINWANNFDYWGTGGEYQIDLSVTSNRKPYAQCGNITGADHTFSFVNNGYVSTARDLYIGTQQGFSNIYSSATFYGDAANDTEHAVTNLPTDGSTLHLTLYSVIDGIGYNEYTTCTASSGGEPEIFAPLPGSILAGNYTTSGTSDTIKWRSNGASVTNYWLYIGSSLGGRQIHNSGDLGTALTEYVNGIPNTGRTVYARLWYSRDNGANWNYSDVTYRTRNNDNGPYVTDPAPGVALGDGAFVLWTDTNQYDASDKYRVYAGPQYGTNTWTTTANLPAATRSHYIDGWTSSDYGKTVWVRFLWRKAGVWKRTNHSYVAGYGPASIDAEASRPVPVGQ